MIDPCSLNIKDKEMCKAYNKAVSTKAYESQFHVLVVFLFSFVSSVAHFLVLTSRGAADDSSRYRIYADLLRFVVYLIVIIASYKFDILKYYSGSLMTIFFDVVLTELYIIIDDYDKLFTR